LLLVDAELIGGHMTSIVTTTGRGVQQDAPAEAARRRGE
jgi:hypothetical protein